MTESDPSIHTDFLLRLADKFHTERRLERERREKNEGNGKVQVYAIPARMKEAKCALRRGETIAIKLDYSQDPTVIARLYGELHTAWLEGVMRSAKARS